jgi:hypothetical protein
LKAVQDLEAEITSEYVSEAVNADCDDIREYKPEEQKRFDSPQTKGGNVNFSMNSEIMPELGLAKQQSVLF